MKYLLLFIIILTTATALFAQDIEVEAIMGDSVIFIQRANVCSEIDLEGIAVDDSFPGAYVTGDFAVWERGFEYFMSDSCFWSGRCEPGHTLDGFDDSLKFKMVIWRHGYAYCGVYSPTGEIAHALLLLADKETRPITTWARPLTRDDIYTSAFFSRLYNQNVLAKLIHHQYEMITDNGHVLSGALPILRDRLCYDPPSDSSGNYLYGYNLLDFALFNNLDKPVWLLASKITVVRTDMSYSGCWFTGIPILDGPNGASYYIENNAWCALCPDSLGLCVGESERGFDLNYIAADNSAIRMQGGSNNFTEAWGYLDGTLGMHILNCCTDDYASANYYVFDTYPDSVRMKIWLNTSNITAKFRMAVVADSVWADNVWEDPMPGHDGNPPPLILKANPGWNGVLTPGIEITPVETLYLGSVIVDETGMSSFTIENPGDTNLVITTLQHSDHENFGVHYTVYTAPDDSSLITVTFHPADTGYFEDRITLFTNVPCHSLLYLYIVGYGVKIDPMRPEIVEPAPWTWTSCEDQQIILNSLCTNDTNCCRSVMEAAVVFDVNDRLYSSSTGHVHIENDTLIVFTPIPPDTFENGDTIEVCLANAADTCGVVFDSLPFCWTFLVDLTPPVVEFVSPTPETVIIEPLPTIELCLFDSLSGLDTSSIALTVDGDLVDAAIITSDTCATVLWTLETPLQWGDTVVFCVTATDSTDYCDDNILDTCFTFYLWSQGPLARLLTPGNGIISACTEGEIRIAITDTQGVNPASIVLAIDSDTLTCADSRLSFIDDSILVFAPGPGYWANNDTIHVILLAAEDVLGAPLQFPLPFTFFTDFAAPEADLIAPPEDSWIEDLGVSFELSFEDLVSPVDLDESYIEIEGREFPFGGIAVAIAPDGLTGQLLVNPYNEGIEFIPGDTVEILCHVCDAPDTCGPNCADYPFIVMFAPMTTCQIYPNPFTPNGDRVNDFVVLDYPNMFMEAAEFKVFDIRNQLVYERHIDPVAGGDIASHSWDGCDGKGEPLQPGLYIYMISNDKRVVCVGTVVIAK